MVKKTNTYGDGGKPFPSEGVAYIIHLYIDPITGWGEEDLSIRYPAVSGRVGKDNTPAQHKSFSEDYAWQGLMSALSASGLASVEFSPESGDFTYNISDSGARTEWRDQLKNTGLFQDFFRFTKSGGEGGSTVILHFINEHPAFHENVRPVLEKAGPNAASVRLNDAPPEEGGAIPQGLAGEPEIPTDMEGFPPLFSGSAFDPEGPVFDSGAWKTEDDAYHHAVAYGMKTASEPDLEIPPETPEIVLEEYYELEEGMPGLPEDAASQAALVERMQETGAKEDPGMRTLVVSGPFWAAMADYFRKTAKYQRVNDSPMNIRRLEGAYDHYVYTSGHGDVMHLYLEILCTQNA